MAYKTVPFRVILGIERMDNPIFRNTFIPTLSTVLEILEVDDGVNVFGIRYDRIRNDFDRTRFPTRRSK